MALPYCSIDETGFHAMSYADILESLRVKFKAIYGQDLYLENDSQDGQMLALFALAMSDVISEVAAVFNAYSPATAQGTGLSSIVKINGISRNASSNSTVDIIIVGQVGSTLNNGIVSDISGNDWVLPSIVVIPQSGQITVTATSAITGAYQASAGQVNVIKTPSFGIQSVSNPLDAIAGQPVETDALLRVRQAQSTALPSVTILEGIKGSIDSINGVIRCSAYENDTNSLDANGLPGHTICLVVDGGDSYKIAQTIALRKTPGTGTFGTVVQSVLDKVGIAHDIRFFRPQSVGIRYTINLNADVGFTADIKSQIANAIVTWTNSLKIGQDVVISRVYLPANLYGSEKSQTYEIQSIKTSRGSNAVAPLDIIIGFNEAANTNLNLIDFVVD